MLLPRDIRREAQHSISDTSLASSPPPPEVQPSQVNTVLRPADPQQQFDELNCKPQVRGGGRVLDMIVPAEASEWPVGCTSNPELCEVVSKVAVNREVLVAVCNSAVIGQLDKWVDANRRAKITNMLIIAIDEKLPQLLDARGVAYWRRVDKALGSHKISAQKFKFVRAFLAIGVSVIMSDIDVVYIQNPFDYLHRDADIEGTTDGWDDGFAARRI